MRVARLAKSGAWRANSDAQRSLGAVVEYLLPHSEDWLRRCPPVFIIGAPRCGSTLLSQCVVQSLQVGYISNRHASFFGAPALIQYLAPPHLGAFEFDSLHGRTEGAAQPSECGEWWYRFFPRFPTYVDDGQLKPRRRRAFVRALASLTASSGRPVVMKNLYASARIREISSAIPTARYIVLRRDVADNACSLLRARFVAQQDYSRWFSLLPPGADDLLSADPATQVVGQVRLVNAMIERDLRRSGVPGDQILELRYEDFCADPHSSIRRISDFVGSGFREGRPGSAPLPRTFEIRRETRIPHDLLHRVSILTA